MCWRYSVTECSTTAAEVSTTSGVSTTPQLPPCSACWYSLRGQPLRPRGRCGSSAALPCSSPQRTENHMIDLTPFTTLLRAEHNLVVIAIALPDRTVHVSVVNAGVLAHPRTGAA